MIASVASAACLIAAQAVKVPNLRRLEHSSPNSRESHIWASPRPLSSPLTREQAKRISITRCRPRDLLLVQFCGSHLFAVTIFSCASMRPAEGSPENLQQLLFLKLNLDFSGPLPFYPQSDFKKSRLI